MKVLEILNLLEGNINSSPNFERSKGSACVVIAHCAESTHLSGVALASHWGYRLARSCLFAEKTRIAFIIVSAGHILRLAHANRGVWTWLQLAWKFAHALSDVWVLNRVAGVSCSHLASPWGEALSVVCATCRRIWIGKVNTIDRTELIRTACLDIYFL